MRALIKNIGIISEAEIDIDGISVIAAENNSGKSTIGKILYATIKFLNNFERDFKANRINQINVAIRNIIRIVQNYQTKPLLDNYFIDDFFDIEDENTILKEKDEDPIFFEVVKELSSIRNRIHEYLVVDESPINMQLEEKLKRLDISKTDKKMIDENLKQIRKVLLADKQSSLNRIFLGYLKDQFGTSIVKFGETFAEITLFEGQNLVFFAKIKNDSCDIKVLKNIFAKDVTYIESPYIFRNDRSSRRRVPFYFGRLINLEENPEDDLFYKLTSESDNENIFREMDKFEDILKKIETCIEGSVSYVNDDDKFQYIHNNNSIDFNNTATGVKSFAILALLLKNTVLNKNDILVIDEPEVHLHPIWQVKLAEIIALMAKELDLKIVINTHSSYFIEAICELMVSYKIEDKSNLYLLEKKDNASILRNTNLDLKEVFKLLNKSFDLIDEIKIERLQ